MEAHWQDVINREARFNWTAALIAGVMAGAIVWLLSHGTPWFTSAMVVPTLMGRDLESAAWADENSSFMIELAHLVLSLGYGLVIAAAVTHLRGLWAISLGALIGLVLYGLNFLAFHLIEQAVWSGTELAVMVTHFVFGAVAAGLYKGLAARKLTPQFQ